MIKSSLENLISKISRFLRKKLRFESDDLPYYITIVIAVVLFSVSINLFLELADSLEDQTLEPYDTQIFEFIRSFRTENLTTFYRLVTDLGDKISFVVIISILSIYLWIRHRNWRFSLEIIIVLIFASLSNVVLKQIINRQRPQGDHLVDVNTLSFPSGHSMSAMAFYGFLIYLCMRFNLDRRLRAAMIGVLLFIIINIGISRIYLGVHYPSDVAAGMTGGLLWTACCIVIFNVIELYRRKNRSGIHFRPTNKT